MSAPGSPRGDGEPRSDGPGGPPSEGGQPGPPRAVVCDFGGVLTTPLQRAITAWQEASGITSEQLGEAMGRAADELEGEHPLFELERGNLSEREFLDLLERCLDGGVRLAGFRETYFGHVHRNDEMIAFMGDLRERGLRMALLTNNIREWEPHWRSMIPELDEVFEVVVDSAFVGMRKPEPEIYELTVERLGDGLRPADCVFVDDTEVNIEGARAVGMRAVHFTDTESAVAAIEAELDGR